MKKMILATLIVATLPALAIAEMKMQNSNPAPEPVQEPTLGHHMQNRDPSPEPVAEPAPAPEHVMRNTNPSPALAPKHVMKNTNPKKWVSSNAGSLEEKHSGEASEAKKK
jgi:hypothetical protein